MAQDAPRTALERQGLTNVAAKLLDPRETWRDGDAYDRQSRQLAKLFRENFCQFDGAVSAEIANAGPTLAHGDLVARATAGLLPGELT